MSQPLPTPFRIDSDQPLSEQTIARIHRGVRKFLANGPVPLVNINDAFNGDQPEFFTSPACEHYAKDRNNQ